MRQHFDRYRDHHSLRDGDRRKVGESGKGGKIIVSFSFLLLRMKVLTRLKKMKRLAPNDELLARQEPRTTLLLLPIAEQFACSTSKSQER